MNKHIKTILIALIGLLGLGLALHQLLGSPTGRNSGPGGALSSAGIRYDGYYRFEEGGVVRMMRFFPQGNVVTINGTKEVEATLPLHLTANAQGDPGRGLHNVPVRTAADSLFFTLRVERGALDLRGKVTSASTVRFERYSHINGARHVFEYIFHPDTPTSLDQR